LGYPGTGPPAARSPLSRVARLLRIDVRRQYEIALASHEGIP
jgi:hypothetical protein